MQARKEFTDYRHLKELGGLELLKAQYHQKQFSKHVHEGYCIGVIEEGAQSFYRSGQRHIAPKGDIILVNSDEAHTGSSAVDSGWSYRAIYPTPKMLADVTQDFFIKQQIPWFPNAVIHDQGLAQQFVLLFDLLEQHGNTLLKETMYLSTLACLVSRYSRKPQAIIDLPEVEQKINFVKSLMTDTPEYDFSLNELAELVSLSSWHFLRQFKKIVGMPPHAWLIQIRLSKARKQLKQGYKISDVALNCGFSDQSHFNRHFKKAVGVTPLQYISYLK